MTLATILTTLLAATPTPTEPPAPPIILRDVAADRGIDFRYTDGSRGRCDLPEIMGGGVGLIDADGDGRLDLYFANGGPIDSGAPEAVPSPCRLYRNTPDGSFRDITEAARAPGPPYATGIAVADYDGDGRDDLFVTGWRDQRLYRNLGGRFEDVTGRAGLRSDRWGTGAAWADLDADGDLDLIVVNYVEYDPAEAPRCAAPDGRRDFCGPEDFHAQADRLYRNNGDGTFTDVAGEAWGESAVGPGLGVLVADLSGDTRPDVFVANDGAPCRLYENLGGLRFRETAPAAGVAFDGQGNALAGMGVASGDIDGDGRTDLVVGNLFGRTTVAFAGRGHGAFADVSAATGLTAATRHVTGFGLALADLDADGRLDLIQANGHVQDRARFGTPFAMRPTVLRGEGRAFAGVGSDAGAWASRPTLGRGLAVGDLDGDGRPDVVLTSIDAPPALLRNESSGRPVVLRLVGRSPLARVPFGAKVRVTAGGTELVRDLPGGGSYLSASEPSIYLGLGDARRIDRLDVTWPSGKAEAWHDLDRSGTLRIVEGTGRPVD